MTTALDVAKLFLFWANEDGDVITNLKMQKLLYFAQAWHLVNFKRPLFTEAIEAWPLGPVIPSVYKQLKTFGPRPIEYSDKGGKEAHAFSSAQVRFLREFYVRYSRISATELVNMSHADAPWKDATAGNGIIDRHAMQQFYTRQLSAKN